MIHFTKYWALYLIISAIVIGVGAFSILKWNYTFSIDFVGGTNIEYQLTKTLTEKSVQNILGDQKIEVQTLNVQGSTILLRSKPLDEKQELALRTEMESKSAGIVKVLKYETVGPVLGKEMMVKTFLAGGLAILGILLYMAYAFRSFQFAAAAIIALIHDFFVVLGIYSLFSHFLGAQVDTLFVTALLTAMSFSVHDTIIIFDKIREYTKKGIGDHLEDKANRALTENFVRSVNNSMTIIIMLTALTILGGSTIRFFAATLLIGTITGTYSSPFIATPALVLLERFRKK